MNPIYGRPDPATSSTHSDGPQDASGRFRGLFDAVYETVVFTEKGVIVEANRRFAELFRIAPEAIGRASLSAFVAPESLAAVMEQVEGDTDSVCEARLQRHDGSHFEGELHTYSFEGRGRRLRMTIIRDITERKQADARNRLFLELITDLSQAVTQTDVASILANKGMRGIGAHIGTVGIVSGDGRTLRLLQGAGFSQEVYDRYQELSLDFPAPLTDAARTGEPVWIETQEDYLRRYPQVADIIQNQTRSSATACLPLRSPDGVIGAIGLSFAMPHRFEPEERDFLMALAHQATQALDRARLYEAERHARAQAEAAAERMTRLQTVMVALSEALTPLHVAAVIVAQGIAAFDANACSISTLADHQTLHIAGSAGYGEAAVNVWRQIPLSKEVPLAVCVRELRPVWVHTRAELESQFPQLLEVTSQTSQAWAALPLIVDGRAIGALGFSFPVEQAFDAEDRAMMQALAGYCAQALERARLYEAEAQARAEAEKANELKIRFLGMVSHELRTPLTSIKGFASTLLATDVTFDADTQRQYISIIDTESNKLTSLVEQLLDVSRLQAGTLPIRPQPRDLRDILAIAEAQIQTLTIAHPFHMTLSQRLPPVMADPQRIAQVIVNLVDNACKYSPVGKPIRLRTRVVDGFVEIKVTDEGAGIPKKDREYVFEAFRQLERKTGVVRGAGLGLAICKGVVEAHGGRIWVQDTARRGTTIAFTLPIAV
jgi:PAS domain S-box-containing protein